MPCHSAVLDKMVVISPDQSINTALKAMKKGKAEYAAVVDENHILLGYFSAATLLKNTLPIAVDMSSGVQLDVTVGAAPGIAKRIKNVQEHNIENYMDKKPRTVACETPTWEGVKLLVEYGAPLFVIEESGKLAGIMTEQSAIEELERIQDQ